MITIVHLITGLRRGGAETALMRLVTHMDPQRFRNVVVSLLPPDGHWDELVRNGIEVHSLNLGRPLNPLALLKLRGLLRRIGPNVVQTWLYHADLVGILVCRPFTDTPVVWNIRNSDLNPGGRLAHRLLVRVLAHLSPRVPLAVVNSEAGLGSHRRIGFRPARWTLIPNGYDLAVFRPNRGARDRWRAKLAPDPRTTLIGMVARFDPMKDHESLLAAFGAVQRQLGTARLVLAGVGISPENKVLARALARHGVTDHVTLLGERDDIPDLLPALNMLVLPSAFGEGFPNALCEAMASGVPVVATDVGDIGIILSDGGIVVPPRDAGALAEAILQIAGLSEGEQAALGLKGRAQIENRYSMRQMVESYEKLYLDVLRPG